MDPVSLSRCLMALEAWGGQMTVSSSARPLVHPISVLAEKWFPEGLEVVLNHTKFLYPFGNSTGEDDASTSLSAMFQYPIHRAVASLRRYTGSAEAEDMLPESPLVRTLRVLIEHSFEPNERVEVHEDDPWSEEFHGFTPLAILCSLALEMKVASGNAAAPPCRSPLLVADAAEFLVRNGARLGTVIEPTPKKRLRRLPSRCSESSENLGNNKPSKLRFYVDSVSKQDKVLALGGEERLKKAQKEWDELGTVVASGGVDLLKDDKESFSETDTPGGSTDKSCAICWKEFGPLMNRKHRCRITRRFVCDDCSKKRVAEDGLEYRITDGQFSLARVEAVKHAKERSLVEAEQERVRAVEAAKKRSEDREAAERANRDSLFGNVVERATNFVLGAEEAEGSTPTAKAEGLKSSLNETRNALLQRGQKLESLGEKSSQMVDASADFARMAKELRKKSESSNIFW